MIKPLIRIAAEAPIEQAARVVLMSRLFLIGEYFAIDEMPVRNSLD
jgi:hypothetical protein